MDLRTVGDAGRESATTGQFFCFAFACVRVLGFGLLGSAALVGCVQKVDTAPASESTGNNVTLSELTTSQGVAMVLIPGGQFTMGNTAGADDEQPAHDVELSPFVVDKYEVTQDQYAQMELPNPPHFKGPRRPVEQVRWSDAALFCNERSRVEGLTPCYDEVTFACDFQVSGYRLPTEAEWEYAARAGVDEVPAASGTARSLENHACYADNSSKQTQPVGSRRPNAWGLYDMQGNIAEWCNDIYAVDYYAQSPSLDPHGPPEGEKRVIRGGSWKSTADECRLTARLADDPGISDACFARDTFGFRCVRRATDEERQQVSAD